MLLGIVHYDRAVFCSGDFGYTIQNDAVSGLYPNYVT